MVGSGGHDFGTALPDANKAALLEYLVRQPERGQQTGPDSRRDRPAPLATAVT